MSWSACLENSSIKSLYHLTNSDNNINPNILKEIKSVEFPHLKNIDLSRNQLCSIEVICQLAIPSVEDFYLRMNMDM